MEGTLHDDEDHHMGVVDVDLIKKLNTFNESDDLIDCLDCLEGGIESKSIEETTVSLPVPTILLSVIVFVSLIISFIVIYNSTKCLKSLFKCGKSYNKRFKRLMIRDDTSFLMNRSLSSKSHEASFSSSGSGSGIGFIRQRTVADEIEFISKIEPSSFGRTWLCLYRGQAHACRVYNTLEQSLWLHEVEMLSSLRNPSLFGMIAKDIRNDPITSSPRFLIITEYYPSLYQFLRVREIDEITMINLIHSIAAGLHYLHFVVLGNPVKPAVIHFNLKSRNIMVDNSGSQCLISDFCNSYSFDQDENIDKSPSTYSSNPETLRYRAPELLTGNEVPKDPKYARACDIYSFSLIMWEIASRCIIPGTNGSVNHVYQLPYQKELNQQKPNREIMNQLVNVNGIRPKISNRWSTCSSLFKISKILTNSWSSLPLTRLQALRIMKDLDNLRESLESKDNHKMDLSSIKIIS